MNTTQLKEYTEYVKKLKESVKDYIKWKYSVGDMFEGEVNVFYIIQKVIAERVVDVEEEIIPGVKHFANAKDWAYVPEYIVECITQNKTYQYSEKQLDKMIENGCTLHRKVLNENKSGV